jgi:acetylornithine deacetylase
MTADRLLDAARAILGDLIAYPTVSSESNLGLIGYAGDHLRAAGARLRFLHDETGRKANLFATFGPEGDGGVILSGHTDVVPATPEEWRSDPFEMREDGGRLYGRGACDMKGFIAAVLALAPQFGAARLHRPLHVALTYDEEVGCFGAQHLVGALRETGLFPSVAIIGEPTEMRVIEGHKGCHEYTTRFDGREGHGSDPDAGVNAVEYAARFIGRLMELREELKARAPQDNRFTPPWSTVQVGRIHGGSARNVIAGHCAVDWELRPINADDAGHALRAMRGYAEDVLLPAMRAVAPEARIETEAIAEVAGLEPASRNEARDIAFALTGADMADLVPFGTEAGLFQAMGLSAVVCGPGSIAQAHKADEFVSLDQLGRCLGMLQGLSSRLSA